MHIKKYTRDYTRRHFLQTMGAGFTAGVLAPLFDVIAADGDITKAYPEELLSLDLYTKGKVKAGDKLTADNIDYVKDLVDDCTYIQVKQQGRIIDIAPTTTNAMVMNPLDYIKATMSNQGQAKFDEKGNVVTQDGKPWIGGNPFPKPKDAGEVIAGHNLSWGRYDVAQYCIDEFDMDADGNEQYHYNFWWCEVAGTGRVTVDPKPILRDEGKFLRYQSAVWTYPNDIKGTALLVWEHPQTDDERFLFLPALGRVRRIASEEQQDSFAGSDLSYEDIGNRKVSDYTWSFVDQNASWVAPDGPSAPAWVVQSVARSKTAKYPRVVSVILKDRLIVVHSDIFNQRDEREKAFDAKRLEKVDGIWTVTALTMTNDRERTRTELGTVSIKYNVGLSNDDFTRRRLEEPGS